MFFKVLVLQVLFVTSIYAEGFNNYAYININSNVKDTKIYLDNLFIGTTPIEQYQVTANKEFSLYALANKNLYKKDIVKLINLRAKTVHSFDLNFKKGEAELFLVGKNGELYIDDKFIKVLDNENRNIKVEAKENLKIHIRNEDEEITIFQDVYVDEVYEIPYKLIFIPKDVRLYTVTIDNLMWEDTKEAANTPVDWENGYKHCERLNIGKYKDWKVPTLEQLELLYKNKDKVYNGFGGKFYWSNHQFQDKKKIWSYAYGKEFEDGEVLKSIKELKEARIRCVREIEIKEPNEDENMFEEIEDKAQWHKRI